MPKKDLFVTLSDRNYLEQAKQLFSSLYFNAGWRGDYMLLAHDVPDEDLVWFHQKGILIRHCRPLFNGTPGGMNAVLTSKFYLFLPEFKKWRTIIYSDADATVRASLDELCAMEGFYSVPDTSKCLKRQVVSRSTIKKRSLDPSSCRRKIMDMCKKYDLRKPGFCAGFFVFDPDTLIQGKNIFQGLCETLRECAQISEYGDQLAFNLYFYHSWKKLPIVYNFQAMGKNNIWWIPSQEVRAIIVHFVTSDKPWISKNYFYTEWIANLKRADRIDLTRIPSAEKIWSRNSICESDKLLNEIFSSKLKYVRKGLDWFLGQMGLFLRALNKRLYVNLTVFKKRMNLDRTFSTGLYVVPERLLKKLRDSLPS